MPSFFIPVRRLALLLLPALLAATGLQAQEYKPPKFVAVRVGFADRYKVGVWTPIEVTLHGGNNRAIDGSAPRWSTVTA